MDVVLAVLGTGQAKKHVGLPARSKSLLSHLGVVGSCPGDDNLWQPLGGYAAPIRLCMIEGKQQAKVGKIRRATHKHIICGVLKNLSLIHI